MVRGEEKGGRGRGQWKEGEKKAEKDGRERKRVGEGGKG